MGIYLYNMEMPKERESFTVTIKYNGLVFDTETGIQVAEAQELLPHGRLVDADKLLSEPMKQKYYHLPNGDIAIPIIDVERAPTIIEAEEVYGQYTDTAGNFHWCGTHSGEHTIKAEEGKA